MSKNSLGIIAGKGNYPLLLAESARKQGVEELYAVAFRRETDPAIEKLVDKVDWLYVGEMGKFLNCFEASGVKRAVMAGQISPKNLFNVRMDRIALNMISNLKERNAKTIFAAIGDLLEGVNVELSAASLFMENCMPEAGLITQRDFSETEAKDAALGVRVAEATTQLNIGQTVVVKEGTILAVEAFEGTDAAIKRGGEQGGAGSVVIKAAGKDHDMRFDIPVIAERTLRSMKKAGATALAVEAGKSIFLGVDKLAAQADKLGIAIKAVEISYD